MGSHKGWDRHFVTIEGLTMKTGRSLNLATGQFGVVNMEAVQTNRGLPVISSFGSLPKSNKLELRLGVAPVAVTRSQSNKSFATQPFKISEVVGLRVDAPKVKGIGVDHFRIGYDGVDPATAIVLENGDNEVIEIGLSGAAIGMLGYTNSEAVVKLYLEAPNEGDFTNQEVIERAVERFNRMTLIGGVPITNYVEARPVNSEGIALVGTDYTFFKLTLKDNGDYTSMAFVQAQYPTFKVEREEYMGGYSTYVILAPAVTVLADYQETVTSTLPDCDDCPVGFTLTDGLCVSDGDPVETAWVAGDTCKASTETYTITLADDECGENRLAELQAAYPDLTIAVSTEDSANSRRTITLTGTSGTANINIAGTDYLATFATDLTTTAANFVTAHAATILSAKGVTVTANAGVLTLTHATVAYPTITITNATTNLAGTLSAVTVVPANVTGGCMTTYSTTVTTDVVCEECSPILNNLFTSEAPLSFDQVDWKKTSKTYSEDALMGIDFKAKAQIMAGNEYFRDDMPFIASSVRLRVTGGEPEVSESFMVGRKNRMPVKLISRAQEPESFGGEFYDWEQRGNKHFGNRMRFEGNNYGNWVLGQESHLKPTAQYVDYVLSVRTVRFAQSFTGEVVENFNYHILAEVGKHQDIEDVLNDLATAASIDTVQAYS
jgi:hypothetical protein